MFKGRFIMFVSFNSVFNNKPQAETKVPNEVLEYMNEQLPHGVKYIADSRGVCSIKSDGKKITLSGFCFNPTEEQKKILGENYTYQEVLDYSYNAQQKIPLLLRNDGIIILNGKEIPIKDLSSNPLLDIKYVSGSLTLFPHQFPKPFSITIGDGKYSRELIISRIPNESVHIAMFQSKEKEPMMIKFSIDEVNQKMDLNVSYDLKYATSIRDVVETTMIFNAYLSGKAFFDEILLDKVILGSTNKQFDVKSAIFWEKVLKIEECLNVQFTFPKKDVSFDDFQLVEKLYQNLINEKPIRNTEKITSIDGDWQKDFKESIGHSISFIYNSVMEINLFKLKLSLPVLQCIYNVKIKDIQKKELKTRIVLEDETEEKKQYNCSMIFKNIEKLNEYKNKEFHEIINIFNKAKSIEEYIE